MFEWGRAICYSGYRQEQSPKTATYPTYEQIKEAVDKMDYDEILRSTHTMKGIASNLEFTHLQQKSAKAVDMIRAGQREEVLPVIGEIEKEYQKVIEQIQKLD